MSEYKLITTRVREDTYQHRFLVNNIEINIGDLCKCHRDSIMAEGIRDAQILEETGNSMMRRGKGYFIVEA